MRAFIDLFNPQNFIVTLDIHEDTISTDLIGCLDRIGEFWQFSLGKIYYEAFYELDDDTKKASRCSPGGKNCDNFHILKEKKLIVTSYKREMHINPLRSSVCNFASPISHFHRPPPTTTPTSLTARLTTLSRKSSGDKRTYAGIRSRGGEMLQGLVPFVQQYIIPASITSYRAGWMAFTIRGILCATHTWPHIPRHGRRYLHPAETRPQNRRENMPQDFSRECRRLSVALSLFVVVSLSLGAI